MDIDKHSRVCMERQRPRMANAILKEKKRVEGLTLPNFKT